MSYASRRLASLATVTERPHMSRNTAVMRTAASTTIPAVNVTAAGSAHTKGSWATIIASTSITTTEIEVTIGNTAGSGTGRMGLMDIAIGPSGSPTMLIENLLVGSWFVTGQASEQHRLKLQIPAGVELIARVQSQTLSTVYPTSIALSGNASGAGARTFRKITTMGADVATSVGVALATPAAINTKGAWTTILDPVVIPAHALLVGIGPLPSGSWQTTQCFVDIGIGAAASEVVIIPDIYVTTQNNEVFTTVQPLERFIEGAARIPAGVRVAARFQTANISQGMSVALYGHN